MSLPCELHFCAFRCWFKLVLYKKYNMLKAHAEEMISGSFRQNMTKLNQRFVVIDLMVRLNVINKVYI